MRTVIVTAIGSFSAPAVIRELKEAGCRVVGTDINPKELIAMSAEADVFENLPRCDAGEAYVDALAGLIRREKADAVLPLTDAELDVLNEVRDRLQPAELWASPAESVRISRDKVKSRAAAERAGAKVIPTGFLAEALPAELRGNGAVDSESINAVLQVLLTAPGLPLILKPRDGRSSQGLYRVRTEKELSGALEEIFGAGREKDYLVQPLIEGRIVTVDVVRFPDGRCTALPREEYVRTWNGAGLSVHVFRDSALEETCRAVAEELGVLGCVNFEFIHAEDGTYYFMECNPRFSGGTGFSIAAGDHIVRKHLAAFGAVPEEEKPERGAQFRDVTECWIARKYVEVITEK